MVSLRRCLLTVLGLLLSGAASTALPQAVAVESQLAEHFSATPGGQYAGHVTLSNKSGVRASMVMYQNDYYRSKPGELSFSAPGENPHSRSNLSWISLDELVIDLAPFETRNVPFFIAVPAQEREPGTYWSAIMVESLDSAQRRDSQLPPSPTRYGIAMTASYRTAVLVTTTLGGFATPRVTFLAVSSRSGVEGEILMVDLRNEGLTALRKGRMWVELYDRNGSQRGQVLFEDLEVMLPGNSYRREAVLDAATTGAGVYRCVVVLDAGQDSLFGTQATVTVPITP